MQLNGISLISYAESGNEATFVLETDLKAALALDGQTLTITAGKDTVAVFTGYQAVSVSTVGKYTHLRAMRALSADTAGAISDLQSRYESLKSAADSTTTKLDDLQKQVDENAGGIEELASMAAGGDTSTDEGGTEDKGGEA